MAMQLSDDASIQKSDCRKYCRTFIEIAYSTRLRKIFHRKSRLYLALSILRRASDEDLEEW